MKKEDIKAVFDVLSAQNPEPVTELHYNNVYTLLVAVVLSAQSTDVGVNKATKHLFKNVNTPEQMLTLGEEGLKAHIKTIGLYNGKAKNVIALSHALITHHGSAVPADRKALEALPGVGEKTAAVVMNCAFGEPTVAVDTHVYRVSNRLGIVKTDAPHKTEIPLTQKLSKALPKEMLRHAHHWLILHGRYICKARSPQCQQCDVVSYCRYKAKNL